MPPKLLNEDGDLMLYRPLAFVAEQDCETFARAMHYPIIPCDLCGSQEGLQRMQVKKLLDDWEVRSPGRRQVMFRALMNVRPSHLADPALFDFAGLMAGSAPTGARRRPAPRLALNIRRPHRLVGAKALDLCPPYLLKQPRPFFTGTVVVPMDDQNKNLLLATVLSFVVILVWFVLFPPEERWWTRTPPAAITQTQDGALTPPATATPDTATATAEAAEPLPEAPRLTVDTPELVGSISLLGGRIDDLSLKGYKETLEPDSPIVRLLSACRAGHPYYARFRLGPRRWPDGRRRAGGKDRMVAGQGWHAGPRCAGHPAMAEHQGHDLYPRHRHR